MHADANTCAARVRVGESASTDATSSESGFRDWVSIPRTSTLSPESTGTEKNDGAGFATRYLVKLREMYRCHGKKSILPPPFSTSSRTAALHSYGTLIGRNRPQFHRSVFP